MTRTTSSPALPASSPSSRRTGPAQDLGHQADDELVEQPGPDALLDDARPHQVHSLPVGHRPRLPDRRLDATGHERVRRVACGHRSGRPVSKDNQRQAGYRASSSPGTGHVVGPAPGDDCARPADPSSKNSTLGLAIVNEGLNRLGISPAVSQSCSPAAPPSCPLASCLM